MPGFQTKFLESKGQPIEYEGKRLVLGDFFPVMSATRLRLVIESCRSTFRQGVALDLAHRGPDGRWRRGATTEGDGELMVAGKKYNGRKGIFLWQDDAQESFEFQVHGRPEAVDVFNVWEVKDHRGHPYMDSRHNGAAMIVEEIPNGRRYRCNDGEPDEDFDDIVFRLERVE